MNGQWLSAERFSLAPHGQGESEYRPSLDEESRAIPLHLKRMP
jgi:hypothetical protein